LLVEFLVILSILLNFNEHFQALLDNILLDDFEDLVLLEGFSGDVQGEIFRIYYSLNKGEPFWDEFFTVVHDEDSSDIQFDVVLLLLLFEQVEWGSLWDEQECFELELTFNREVLLGEVFFPIIGE